METESDLEAFISVMCGMTSGYMFNSYLQDPHPIPFLIGSASMLSAAGLAKDALKKCNETIKNMCLNKEDQKYVANKIESSYFEMFFSLPAAIISGILACEYLQEPDTKTLLATGVSMLAASALSSNAIERYEKVIKYVKKGEKSVKNAFSDNPFEPPREF